MPFASRLIIAEFRSVLGRCAGHRYKPVARLGVNMDFGNCPGDSGADENAEDQMSVGRLPVATQLLFAREVPICVKPVRIARRQEKPASAVGRRKFSRFDFKLL